jgi:hypothetical protein
VTYVETLAAEIRARVPDRFLPDGDLDSLFLLYALLCLTKGQTVVAEDVHNAWVVWMVMRHERHPSRIPFKALDPSTRAEDEPFVAAIRGAAAERARGD